jgi:hypothetical protein
MRQLGCHLTGQRPESNEPSDDNTDTYVDNPLQIAKPDQSKHCCDKSSQTPFLTRVFKDVYKFKGATYAATQPHGTDGSTNYELNARR